MTKPRSGILALVVSSLVVPASSHYAQADSVCGPGKELHPSKWACIPEYSSGRLRSSGGGSGNTANQVIAGVQIGAALLSAVSALASQSQMTDNVGQIRQGVREDLARHGAISREYNRRGLALQTKGDFDGARKAFQRAAREAILAGNQREGDINERNAEIADALLWLRRGYDLERSGRVTNANFAYRQGIDAARRAGNEKVARELAAANDKLIGKTRKSQGMIESRRDNCILINGKYSCP